MQIDKANMNNGNDNADILLLQGGARGTEEGKGRVRREGEWEGCGEKGNDGERDEGKKGIRGGRRM